MKMMLLLRRSGSNPRSMMATHPVGGRADQPHGAPGLSELDPLAASTQLSGDCLQRRSLGLQALPSEQRSLIELALADLTAAHTALEQERRRSQTLIDFVPDAYFVTDLKGRIREANHAASRLIGFARKYCLGKPLSSFVLAEDTDTFQARLARARELTTDAAHTWEIRLRPLRKQARLDALVRVGVIREDGGAVNGLRWLLRDITAEKQQAREYAALTAEQDARLRAETAELNAIINVQSARIDQEQTARRAAEARLRACEAAMHGVAEGVEDFLRTLGADDAAIGQVLGRLLDVVPAAWQMPSHHAQPDTGAVGGESLPGGPPGGAAPAAAG